MGKIKGQTEYRKWKRNEPLTRKEAILAQCYACNGQEEGWNIDCRGEKTCPLYSYFVYSAGKTATSGDKVELDAEE